MPGPDPNASAVDATSRAWITLITRASYLPGVVLLVHTLYKHGSKHAIILQYTDSLQQECVDCLHHLPSAYPLCHVQRVEPLPLPPGLSPIAQRFDDTLTKLRAFAPLSTQASLPVPPLEQDPREVCFLDADIMIFNPLDDIFDIPRPSSGWIAAHHACCCNLDSDPWSAPDSVPSNCPLTPLSHPAALKETVPSSSKEGARSTYQRLNSGVFVCSPSDDLWKQMDHFRLHDDRVKTFTFPDQHFLDEFFKDHWVPIPYTYNALKTHRYWHSQVWRDAHVKALHYIVDKPWEARVKDDGTAGYRGRDGVTHSWWWREYHDWERHMDSTEHTFILHCVRKHVCVDSKLGKTRFHDQQALD